MTDHHTAPLWELLVLTHDHAEPLHLSIEECIELLDFDVDLLSTASPADIEEIRSILDYHLSLCSEHRAELITWLDKIDYALHNLNPSNF